MSIVHELQQAAMDESTQVSALLRKTLAVASKLNLQDSVRWVQRELNGYRPETIETDLPTYRIVRCRIMFAISHNEWRPLQFNSSNEAEKLEWVRIYIPLAEIEAHINKEEGIGMQLPPEAVLELCRATKTRTEFIRDISRSSFIGITSAVRNLVLEWALQLEREGIHGEAPSFTSAEKQKAAGSNVEVLGLVINNNIAIHHSPTQTVTSAAPEPKRKSSWLPELVSKTVKAVPEKWIVVALGSAVAFVGSAYAWAKGWIQTWLH